MTPEASANQFEIKKWQETVVSSATDELHNRPGKIDLTHLYAHGNSHELADNLMQHHDYDVVSVELWRYLVSWYGLKDNTT